MNFIFRKDLDASGSSWTVAWLVRSSWLMGEWTSITINRDQLIAAGIAAESWRTMNYISNEASSSFDIYTSEFDDHMYRLVNAEFRRGGIN